MADADQRPRGLIRVMAVIDAVSVWVGKAFAWMIFPMVGSLVYEVFARYLFSSPTVWATDMTFMLYGSFFMLGAAYTLQRQGHIRTDFFYRLWSVRRQGLIDALLYLFCFFPGIGIFLWIGWDYAYDSCMRAERIVTSPWMPPIYPFKLVIPVSTALLLLQGVSEFLKSVYASLTGKWIDGRGEVTAYDQ